MNYNRLFLCFLSFLPFGLFFGGGRGGKMEGEGESESESGTVRERETLKSSMSNMRFQGKVLIRS